MTQFLLILAAAVLNFTSAHIMPILADQTNFSPLRKVSLARETIIPPQEAKS